jgi:hypothetical protein
MKGWIVRRPYDDPHYEGHPTGLVFTDKEKAEAYLREWEKMQCAKQWRNEMKVKTSEAKDKVLDYLVAKCLGHTEFYDYGSYIRIPTKPSGSLTFCPSTDWLLAGPIIERECIAISCIHITGWTPDTWTARHPQRFNAEGPTPLIAAMRCYVASKLGDEVEIPEELK